MRFFLYFSWIAQLIVSAGLFSISFLIQYAVLQLFLKTAVFAILLALIIEVAKVNAIVWHRYFVNQYSDAYLPSIQWACFAFKAGLFILSVLCSMVYFSHIGWTKDSFLPTFNPEIMAACIQLIRTLFNWQPQPQQIIAIYSILVSLLIELGILLSFEMVAFSMQSLMQKQQVFELNKQLLKAQVHSQQQVDNIKHDANIEQIRSAANNSVNKAKVNMQVSL